MSFCLCKVHLKVKDTGQVRLRINDAGQVRFTSDQYIKIRTGEYDSYEGPYEVTPRLYQQELDTSHKVMSADVTVYEIPITRTSNPQDGLTVLIG